MVQTRGSLRRRESEGQSTEGSAEKQTPTKQTPKNQQRKQKSNMLTRSATVTKFREAVQRHVIHSSKMIPVVQQRRTSFLDWYCRCATFFGDKYMYFVMCPYFTWCVDERLGCEFTLMVAIGTYLGNFWKNAMALPRPSSVCDGVWTPSYHSMHDYGWPSIHSMHSVSIPFFLIFYFKDIIFFSGEEFLWSSSTFFFLLGLWWSMSIAVSRMYLGVHSPTDVMTGLLSGPMLLLFWYLIREPLHVFITTSPDLPWVMLCVLILATVLHPRAKIYSHPTANIPNPTYRDSCALVGVFVGACIGVWLHPSTLAYVKEAGWCCTVKESLPDWVLLSTDPEGRVLELGQVLTRAIAGFLVLGVVTAPFKALATVLFTFAFNLPGVAQLVRAIEVFLEKLSFPYYEEEDPVELSSAQRCTQPHNDPKILVRTLYGLLVGWMCMDPILCVGKLCLSSMACS